MKKVLDSLTYIFINYFVAYIPLWTIRRLFYKLFGMKIGKGSRIYMKCVVRAPWRIKIGENTIINENCYLDGRGGLTIGSNSSISLFSMIISASHDMKSDRFEYRKGAVEIGDNVWIGARAIVLDYTKVRNQCVVSAGAVLKGATVKGCVYIGNPAKAVKSRELVKAYNLQFKDYFR